MASSSPQQQQQDHQQNHHHQQQKQQQQHQPLRLEYAAVARRVPGAGSGRGAAGHSYGFVLLAEQEEAASDGDSGGGSGGAPSAEPRRAVVLASGCGPVSRAAAPTPNAAAMVGLREGLSAAAEVLRSSSSSDGGGSSSSSDGSSDKAPAALVIAGGSALLQKQLEVAAAQGWRPSYAPEPGSPLGAALAALQQQWPDARRVRIARATPGSGSHNALALAQAELAAEVRLLLARVRHTPASGRSILASEFAHVLRLPTAARQRLQAAPDFADAAAEVVALRLGADVRRVAAAMLANADDHGGGSGGGGGRHTLFAARRLHALEADGGGGTAAGPSLAAEGTQQQQQEQQQLAEMGLHELPPSWSGAALGRPLDGDAAAGLDGASPGLPAARGGAPRTAGSSEAVGLGDARYALPGVVSETATHLLQFDGASRNNPGRSGYGWVLFDLRRARLAARGCMSLPYGHTAGRAEFEGLLAGLQAALDLGARRLAVQGDSTLVLDALLHRAGLRAREAQQQYFRAAALLGRFEHVDLQHVPREGNTLADRLANMSMDLDTALYVLLRRDLRGLPALRTVLKAARIAKKTPQVEALLQDHPLPLLLAVLLQRVMALTPAQLLRRLEDKAALLGDPNPWLVQEVRALVRGGIPGDVLAAVGARLMDSRYQRGAERTRVRDAAAGRAVAEAEHAAEVAAAAAAAAAAEQQAEARRSEQRQLGQAPPTTTAAAIDKAHEQPASPLQQAQASFLQQWPPVRGLCTATPALLGVLRPAPHPLLRARTHFVTLAAAAAAAKAAAAAEAPLPRNAAPAALWRGGGAPPSQGRAVAVACCALIRRLPRAL